jgi:hypothetical protein
MWCTWYRMGSEGPWADVRGVCDEALEIYQMKTTCCVKFESSRTLWGEHPVVLCALGFRFWKEQCAVGPKSRDDCFKSWRGEYEKVTQTRKDDDSPLGIRDRGLTASSFRQSARPAAHSANLHSSANRSKFNKLFCDSRCTSTHSYH